jgi:hypothetical protein
MMLLDMVTALAGIVGLLVGIILFLAIVIESLIEALLSPIVDNVPALKPFRWLLQYGAVFCGVLAAFIYRLDLIYLAGQFLGKITDAASPIEMTVFGTIVTGLAIGKGSNYVHQFISKFLPSK